MSLLIRHITNVSKYGDIIHVGSASSPNDGGSNTSATVTITPPAGMNAGDLVWVYCGARNDDNNPITVNNTGGQTWNVGTSFVDAGGDGFVVYGFWCQFNGTWSANPSFNFTVGSTTSAKSGVMHVFRSTSPFFSAWSVDGVTSHSIDSSNPVGTPSRTTLHPWCLSIANWFGVNISTWSGLTGAGWNNLGNAQYRNTGGADITFTFAYRHDHITGTVTPQANKNASINPVFGSQVVITFYPTFSI